jgi:large subunit ribosomal protein L15
MSLLSSLKPKAGSTHYGKRIGRGIGSGMGGTSTKGHKGQLARTGGTVRRGFEGGQTPLSRRLPKFGFTNAAFANVFQIVNLSDFAKVNGDVDAASLYAAGLITKNAQIKILAKGELKKAVNVKAHAVSVKAKEAIEKAGGKVEIIAPKATFKRASK